MNEGLVADADFQLYIARRQFTNEFSRTIRARNHIAKHPDQEVVMLLDRSFICQRAYTHGVQAWTDILNIVFNKNYSSQQMIEYIANRYDGVIHMESNLKFGFVSEGRIETPEEALALEEKVLEASKMCKVFEFVPRQEKMTDKLHLVEKACISIINNTKEQER